MNHVFIVNGIFAKRSTGNVGAVGEVIAWRTYPADIFITTYVFPNVHTYNV
jgi:hypothetical protein